MAGKPRLATDARFTVFHGLGASSAVVRSQRQGGGPMVADAIYVVPAARTYDTYSWAPSLPSAGDYAVYAKWAADAGRASDAVYGVYHAGGLAEVAQDQRAGAGQWAYLGTWAFDPAGSPLVVLAGGSDGTLSADAIRFVGAGPAPADLRFVLGDHLGTPQKLTDNAGAVVWDRLQTPFGLDHSVTGAAATPVRFPGQYADAESGLSYNYFRDYDPSLGRYIQSDPIGLAGGLNTYGYVGGNPLGYVDPYGEASMARAGGFALIAGAGRALSEAVCRVAAAHARDAIKGVGIASLLWFTLGPGSILWNEGGKGESGQSGGGGGAGENGESQGDSQTPTTPIPDTAGTPTGGPEDDPEESAGDQSDNPFAGGRTPTRSEIEIWAEKRGWTRATPKHETSPPKFVDKNGVVRVTLKKGSPRTPGSESPHVELRNAQGQRINPQGNLVTRKSPGNHTPIIWD